MKKNKPTGDKGRRQRWAGIGHTDLGECDPENCREFFAGNCINQGYLKFWIPGISSAGVFSLKIKSKNSRKQIFNELKTIGMAMAGFGRDISGLGVDEEPMFVLRKIRRKGKYSDMESGKDGNFDQHFVQLINTIDPMKATKQAALPPHQGEGQQSLPAPPQDAVEPEPELTGAEQLVELIRVEARRLEWGRNKLFGWVITEHLKLDAPGSDDELVDLSTGDEGWTSDEQICAAVLKELEALPF